MVCFEDAARIGEFNSRMCYHRAILTHAIAVSFRVRKGILYYRRYRLLYTINSTGKDEVKIGVRVDRVGAFRVEWIRGRLGPSGDLGTNQLLRVLSTYSIMRLVRRSTRMNVLLVSPVLPLSQPQSRERGTAACRSMSGQTRRSGYSYEEPKIYLTEEHETEGGYG
jgi:hypothetical protein